MPNDMVAKASVFVRSPSVLSQNYRRIEVIFTDLAVIATNRPTASPLKVGFSSAIESPNTRVRSCAGTRSICTVDWKSVLTTKV
jgi:hypothetical protein